MIKNTLSFKDQRQWDDSDLKLKDSVLMLLSPLMNIGTALRFDVLFFSTLRSLIMTIGQECPQKGHLLAALAAFIPHRAASLD